MARQPARTLTVAQLMRRLESAREYAPLGGGTAVAVAAADQCYAVTGTRLEMGDGGAILLVESTALAAAVDRPVAAATAAAAPGAVLDATVPVGSGLCFRLVIPGGARVTRDHFALFRSWLESVEWGVLVAADGPPDRATAAPPDDPGLQTYLARVYEEGPGGPTRPRLINAPSVAAACAYAAAAGWMCAELIRQTNRRVDNAEVDAVVDVDGNPEWEAGTP